MVWHDSWVDVQASWQEVWLPGSAPPAVGTTQLVSQLAAMELQPIMQVVTADVTVDVCGVTAVVPCAKAVPAAKIAGENAAEMANTIATRRIIASQIT